MIQSHEPAILDLALISLHGAIRRGTARLLEGAGELHITTIRRVERLMRIALDLAGAGNGLPLVEFHGIPPMSGRGAPAGDPLGPTDEPPGRPGLGPPTPGPQGRPGGRPRLRAGARRLLETEDIRRLV